jgi:hypothetical protein
LIPDPNFFHPGSRIRIKDFTVSILTQKTVSKLSETQDRIIPDFLPTRIQGPKRHQIPYLDPQH